MTNAPTVNPGIVAVESMETAGAMVWWRLSGTTTLEALRAAWVGQGLAEALLPDNPSPVAAMRRAVQERCERRVLARPLDNVRGWALVAEHAQGEELTHSVSCRVMVNDEGRLSVNPPDHPLAARLRTDYEAHLASISQRDVSHWMCGLLETVHAVSLRDTGGVYFVPRADLPVWRQVVAALRACSAHEVYEVPALRTEEAVEAILAAVAREAANAATEMEDELMDAALGQRAIRTRAERCERMRAKLAAYEELLGRGLDTITKRVGDLQANLAAAALIASPEEPCA